MKSHETDYQPDDGGKFPLLITVGAYLFGALSLFSSASLFYFPAEGHSGEPKREPWKVWLEEIGIPVVTTLFIIAWGYDGRPVLPTLAFALFLLFIFLFCGKGLLSGFQGVHREWHV